MNEQLQRQKRTPRNSSPIYYQNEIEIREPSSPYNNFQEVRISHTNSNLNDLPIIPETTPEGYTEEMLETPKISKNVSMKDEEQLMINHKGLRDIVANLSEDCSKILKYGVL
jgi:hypothetical protein